MNERCERFKITLLKKVRKFDHFSLIEEDNFLTLKYDGFRICEIRRYGMDYIDFECRNRYRSYNFEDYIGNEDFPEIDCLLELSKFIDSLTFLSKEFDDDDFFHYIIFNLKF